MAQQLRDVDHQPLARAIAVELGAAGEHANLSNEAAIPDALCYASKASVGMRKKPALSGLHCSDGMSRS